MRTARPIRTRRTTRPSDFISILDTADLELTKRADLDIVTAGNLLRYTIRVTNTGTDGWGFGSTATNVRVYDNLPAEVEIVGVTVSDGECLAGTPGDPTDPTTVRHRRAGRGRVGDDDRCSCG